ncbi:MAG: transposase [Prochloraceae cyanobacterium]|nr:transposase [Prochloraceae cyanobacterium]
MLRGKRRWQIEGFFKTIKHRFSLHRFGQETKLGVYRWLILSFISFILAYWTYWFNKTTNELDWTIAARKTLEILFPSVLLNLLLRDIERLEPIAIESGISIQVTRAC